MASEAQTVMISCKDCATLNSIDSAFCKKCGKPLAKEEALDARESLEKQLDHGFELFHHGRTDEAWLNVESCLLADPENLRALSLKGLILERRGLVQEAIECFETIVKRDPNAALERMKLQTLRGVLDARSFGRSAPDKRLPLAIAACVTLLVVSIAGAVAVGRSQKPEQVALTQPDKPAYTVDSFPQNVSQNAKQEQQDDSGATQESAPGAEDSQESNQAATPQYTRVQQPPLNGTLPDVNKTTAQLPPDFKPVNPLEAAQVQPSQSSSEQTVNTPTNNGNVGGPANDTQQSGDPDPSAMAQNEAKTEPKAYLDIKLSDNQAPRQTEATIDSNGIEALVRTARGQYQVGNYQAAATTYEKALAAGADPALTNQRLAQCYERLGRNSDAKAAYEKAISAIQNQINGGKGNKDRLLAALNSSQQALKNLGG